MNIKPIKYNFKSQIKNDDVLGYDDSISRNNRSEIRKWQEATYSQYQSIYEKEPRLTEYQLGLLLKSMLKKPKIVDNKTIMGLPIYNIKPIDSKMKTYRGATLVNHPECLDVLKKSGIERIVDLVGYTKYEHNTKNANLEYYCPRFGKLITGVWGETVFESLEDYLKAELRHCRPYNLKNDKTYIEKLVKQYKDETRESVNDFVELIQFLQKDYFYIGCEYGTDKTSTILLLNEFFNPKAEKQPIENLQYTVSCFEFDFIYELYTKLTEEDKNKLGWTKEFEQDFIKRLKAR